MLSAGWFFRLGFLWYVFPQDRHLLSCFFGRRFLIIPCPFFFCSILANRSDYSFSLFRFTLLTTHLPLSLVFYWPAILTPRYPASGASLQLRLILFWPVILTPGYPVSSSSLPLRRVLFWPAILTPGYPVSGASLPLRLTLFWPVILTPGYPVLVPLSRSAASYSDRLFWRPAIRFPVPLSRSVASPSDRLFYRPDIRFSVPHLPLRLVLFWPAILTPRSPFSGTPGPSFHSPFWYPWSSFSTPSFFPPPNLPFPVIWVAGSLFVPPYGWPAVFTARRFLPLRGFYRSAVFTAPRFLPLRFHRFFGGALLFHRPRACCPPVFPTSGRLALWATLRYTWDFYRSAVFTAPRFFPLRDFYRSAVFTAPRFLPLRGFYRSAVFTAPRFLPLRGFYRSAVFYRSAFTGSLGGFALPPPSCLLSPSLPPTSGRLALWATFRYACDFYRSAIFTAPRFLPLRGFYRSTVFTAPRFLPLRGFYRSAVFTAPRFLPLRNFFRSAFAGSLGGSALPFCPPVFALFRARPVLPAPPSRLRVDTVLDLLFGPPA